MRDKKESNLFIRWTLEEEKGMCCAPNPPKITRIKHENVAISDIRNCGRMGVLWQ